MSEVLGLSVEQWQAISAIATAVLVLVTTAYVVFTYMMVRAIRDTSERTHQLAEAQLTVRFTVERPNKDAPLVNLSCVGASVVVLVVVVTAITREQPVEPEVIVPKPITGTYPIELRASETIPLLTESWPKFDDKTLVLATISYVFSKSGTQHEASLTLNAWPTEANEQEPPRSLEEQ